MNNIFEEAYFGKPYRTRDGRKFVYLGEVESLFGHNFVIQGMIEDNDHFTYYNFDGKSVYCEFEGSAINAFVIDFSQENCEEDCETDIVSEWQEPIDGEEIRQNAIKDFRTFYDRALLPVFIDGYDAGYRKAIEKKYEF